MSGIVRIGDRRVKSADDTLPRVGNIFRGKGFDDGEGQPLPAIFSGQRPRLSGSGVFAGAGVWPLLVPPLLAANPDSSWTYKNETGGVKIYTKKSAGGLTVYRGELSGLTLSPDQVRSAIMSVQGYEGNVKYVKDIEVFSQSASEVVYGQLLNFGGMVPIAERVSVLRLKVEKTSPELVISWDLVAPERDLTGNMKAYVDGIEGNALGKVYNPVNRGRWIYQPAGDGTYTLIQELEVDPGGSVPVSTTDGAFAGNLKGMAALAAKK